MSDHFILKCSICGKVIAQCRCIDANKTVRYAICDSCKTHNNAEAARKEEA